jgi:hypothetical protein
MSCLELYEPIDTIKPVADDVFIVDGPEIRMAALGFGFPFSTRMTLVRLPGNRLWVHSPTPLSEPLVEQVTALGEPAFLIAPNRLHYWWMNHWKARFPNATAYAAPGARQAARRRFQGFDADLGPDAPAEWDGAFEQFLVPGGWLSEVDFLHRPSGTLVVTDLIENVEPSRIGCLPLRLLIRLGGVADPDGKAPHDLAINLLLRRKEAGAAMRAMLAAEPERVILAHGRWYERNASGELRRAIRCFI